MFTGKIEFLWFILPHCQRDSLIKEVNKMGKCIAEKAANAERNIYTRSSELFERLKRDTFEPPRLRVPYRFNTQQCKSLRDVVAVGTHLRSSPDTKTYHLGVSSFLFTEALDRFMG